MFDTRSIRPLVTALLASSLVLGCVSARIENEPLAKYEPHVGYGEEFRKLPNGDKLRVVLAFSGGGTRAAALAYGVLEEMRDTQIVVDGKPVRLLDQVSSISSVSGGSFTAAYYGLNGERIFEDYEDKFLRKDFDTRLGLSLLRPIKLFRFLFTRYSRSDMAMDLYDKEIFGGATFADLEATPGPLLNINATDIGADAIFTFVQPDFNLICSDLSKMRVVKAVTASSAVPGLFAPLVLKNYAGECDFTEPEWIEQALANPTASRRRFHQAEMASAYLDAKEHPYVFLVDGGISDNIGARRLLAYVIHAGGAEQLARAADIELPERVLYIIVNAQAEAHHAWTNKPKAPPAAAVLGAISGTGIYRYNFETVELLRESTDQWSSDLAKHGIEMKPYVAEVAFASIKDAHEREYFNNVKTSFKLSDDTIEKLIAVGGRLLRETPEFQQFIADMK